MNSEIAKAFLHYSMPAFLYYILILVNSGIALVFNPLFVLIGVSIYRHFYTESSLNGFHETLIAFFSVIFPYFGIIYPGIYYLKNRNLE